MMTVAKLTRAGVLTLLCCAVAVAQTPAPQAPKKSPPAPADKAASVDKLPRAPQVVTIVHRLNGLKMFRLLLRSQEQVQAIAELDSDFNLMDDVHTNVIAGLAMDDGETIAAWLPEVDVEFGPAVIPPAPPRAPKAPSPGSFPRLGKTWFDEPDVTVIGPGGKRLAAKYIGLDAVTGLSILRLKNKNEITAGVFQDEPVSTGEPVLLLGPEPATKARAMIGGSLLVRIGAIEGQIKNVLTAPSGDVARFKVTAPKLSHAYIGGVAINEAGETIGIVDGLEGSEASILPAALIRRAADRVLEQQASVPRPWLGVSGEAIAALNLEQLQKAGWEMHRAAALAGKDRGILLTSIVPGSPAADASLRAGDVILKVDNKDIQNAADFTWWLEQAGPSSAVEFTVARPDRPAEEPLSVKLSGMLDAGFNFNFRNRFPSRRGLFTDYGIETIALRRPVAVQLGTTAGLLVIHVEPTTAAFEAGLKPGDVIQTIEGKPAASFKPASQSAPLTVEIVRNKEKLVIKLPTPPKKK
ncbi:MAG TPA: PDZ domain-containing protein [Pyrinomonadaceae bacterium]|nr:PDZ domain-containing protein [Pyrinomonadaceae bacterium]